MVHKVRLSYSLSVKEFAQNMISIPTSPVDPDAQVTSTYLAGKASLTDEIGKEEVGVCSASFLCMQTDNGLIYSDISNYISTISGLIITWFTPTTLLNLELDSIINGMVTECIVKCTTKVGKSPYYGMSFQMIVSSDNGRIYFDLKQIC